MDESLKTKKQKRKTKDLEKQKTRNTSSLKVLFTVAMLVVVVSMFLYSKYIDDKRISVIRLTNPVIAGDVIDINTNFQKHEMLYKAYLEEGMMDVPNEDGTVSRQQGYVLWSDREKFQNWYFNSYQPENSIFTLRSASPDMQYKNPLIETMPEGNEEYVLDIDANGINMHQLFPGTILRMRVAFEVPIALENECRTAISKKKSYDGSSEILNVLSKHGYDVGASGVADMDPVTGAITNTSGNRDERVVVISEVIFEEISAVDMKSTSGESIFEVYMSLLKMPLYERTPYLQTSFDEDKSGEFRARITPKSLVLNLSRYEASRVHEFEAMGYDMKWTIVKTANSSDMLKDFITINEELNAMMLH